MNKQRWNGLRLVVIAAFVAINAIPLCAQDVGPIVVGRKVEFYSRILKETRILWISTPDTVRSSTTRYPLLLLLDAESNFVHTEGIVQFLADADRMPAMIVVGIESTNRERDFTPTPPDTTVPGSGGADTFLRFVDNELLPYVESHYPVAPFRVLIGHSLGGSFVLNAVLSQPRAFNAYIIISPNLWWDNDILVNRLDSLLQDSPKISAYVYETHTMRESPRNIVEAARVGRLIDTYHPEGLHWKMQYFPQESHQSIVHRSIYDGLEFVFSSWEVGGDLSVVGMNGLLEHFEKLSGMYGYTIYPPEDLVNGIGYQALSAGKYEKAISIFKWNVQHYPQSSNVYDSLGEAYARKGDTKMAIENYEKSIERNPKNVNAIRMLQKLKEK